MRINKRGDGAVGMSFGWLFALFLIIAFIGAAIYGIKIFMNFGSCSSQKLSLDELQAKIDNVYQSSSSSNVKVSINMPNVKMLCFANLSKSITDNEDVYDDINIYEYEDANLFLYPQKKACNPPFKKITHLNLEKTIKDSNPLCFEVIDGTVELTLNKDLNDKAVYIK